MSDWSALVCCKIGLFIALFCDLNNYILCNLTKGTEYKLESVNKFDKMNALPSFIHPMIQ
jgi:hypothetical protein